MGAVIPSCEIAERRLPITHVLYASHQVLVRGLFFIGNEERVLHAYPHESDQTAAMIARAKEIYYEHGWPDLSRYRKEECIKAVARCSKERERIQCSFINHTMEGDMIRCYLVGGTVSSVIK